MFQQFFPGTLEGEEAGLGEVESVTPDCHSAPHLEAQASSPFPLFPPAPSKDPRSLCRSSGPWTPREHAVFLLREIRKEENHVHVEFYVIVCFFHSAKKMVESIWHTRYRQVVKAEKSLELHTPQVRLLPTQWLPGERGSILLSAPYL